MLASTFARTLQNAKGTRPTIAAGGEKKRIVCEYVLSADVHSFFILLLKATGEFEVTSGGKPDDLAAIQVNPSVQEWILAKVISHDAASGMYTLSDEDSESNKSTSGCEC